MIHGHRASRLTSKDCIWASLHAAFGTLSALWERRAVGVGEWSKSQRKRSWRKSITRWCATPMAKISCAVLAPATRQPANGYYRCQDGHIFLSLFQPHQWDRLVDCMQDPLLMEPAFRERGYQYAHADVVEEHIQQYAERFDRWTLTEALQRRGLPAAPLCPLPTWRRMCTSRHGTSSSTSSSHPGDACVALVRCSAPLPRLCAYGDQRRDSESTRRRFWAQSWRRCRQGRPALSRQAHAAACRSRGFVSWISAGSGLGPMAPATSPTLALR